MSKEILKSILKETIKTITKEKLSNKTNNFTQNNKENQVSSEEKDEDIIKLNDREVSLETYQNANTFEKNLHGNLINIVPQLVAGNPAEALKALNNFINTAGEITKFTEVQKTERKKIEAKRDIIINKIQSQKEIILTYLEKSFDERKENFAKLFSIVDNAIENNNIQQLAISLDSINKLAASSPFKDLASIENVKLALDDKNHEWDF